MVIKDMKSEILKNEVFTAVLKRIKERKDSLLNMAKFNARGLEGWFKVEIVTALANSNYPVKDIRNRGIDLLLEGEINLELKGQTNFVLSEIRIGLKYGTPCLFLVSGKNKDVLNNLESYHDVKLLRYEIFSDNKNEWILGLISPN